MMDLLPIIKCLSQKRPIFHSEADFQFALAWNIQRAYPTADIRLEYPSENEPNRYIDILVRNKEYSYPIELKYKTKKLSATLGEEQFHLKGHSAQDLGKYDFVKDICRVESLALHLDGFKCGYVLLLTNDPSYWNAPNNPNAGYASFSVHHGAKKSGTMSWGSNLSAGTIKNREKELFLKGEYEIAWNDYIPNLFKYALICVDKE